MGSRRAPKPRRRLGLPLGIAVALVLAAGAVAVGVQLRPTGGGAPRPSAGATPKPEQDVDLSALPIPRGPFCDLLDDPDLVTALGGRASHSDHYNSGDRAHLAPGVTDISHEYGCSFSAASGAVARAWVFAQPVQTGQARALTRRAAHASGCHPVASKPTFGRPSATTACRRKGATEVTLQGLFGESWFSCQLTVPGDRSPRATVRRTESWCVHVAEKVGSSP